MRALRLFFALGIGALWISCGGSSSDNLFASGSQGASGNVTGGSGGSGTAGASRGAAGVGGTTGAGGGKAAGGAAGQGASGSAAGGSAGMSGPGSGAGMAGSATAGMGGGSGTAVVDAGIDAHPVIDAGPKPKIRCATTSCDPDTDFCCLDEPGVCMATGSDGCNRNRDRLHCDDASDCAPTQHCCAVEGAVGNPNDSVCRDACPAAAAGRRVQILCDPEQASSQCPDTDRIC